MANQRKSGKKKVNVWLTEQEKAQLEAAAKAQGHSTLTDFLKWIAAQGGKVGIIWLIGHLIAPAETARVVAGVARFGWELLAMI